MDQRTGSDRGASVTVVSRSQTEQRVADANRPLGQLLVGLGAGCVALWLGSRGVDRHGGIFALFVALWFLPAGLLFLAASVAHRHRWWGRWVVQSLAVLYFLLATFQDPVLLLARMIVWLSPRR